MSLNAHPMRHMVFNLALFLLVCASSLLRAMPADAAEPAVWGSTNDPTHGGAGDFWQLFEPGAPWQSAKRHVAVFSIDQNLVTNGPPDKLRQFYAFLKEQSAERNINAIRALKLDPPDHLVFATWHNYPTKNLPDTSPEAFMHLINTYFERR